MSKKVVIETEECVGCESCVEACPEVFKFDDDAGKAYVIKDAGDADCIEEAIDICPVECIHWE